MKKLVDQCQHHSYVIINGRHKYVTNIGRVLMKETYACVDCGKGLDVYYFEDQE